MAICGGSILQLHILALFFPVAAKFVTSSENLLPLTQVHNNSQDGMVAESVLSNYGNYEKLYWRKKLYPVLRTTRNDLAKQSKAIQIKVSLNLFYFAKK